MRIEVGSRVNGGFNKYGVNSEGGWYLKWFTNYGVVVEHDYCAYLQAGRKNNFETYSTPSQPDPSVCKKPKVETDPGRLGMVRTKDDKNGHAHFRKRLHCTNCVWGIH
jgi:hypothetical protein